MADNRTCSVETCDKPAHSRGWCQNHYRRWHRYGDPLGTPPRQYPPLAARLEARTNKNGPLIVPEIGPCWQWTGVLNHSGYGIYSNGGTCKGAYKWTYELHVGPVPEGLELDHLCDNRACVNPAHLEPVTREENLRRVVERRGGLVPCGTPGAHRRHMKAGEPPCETCRAAHAARQMARMKAKRATCPTPCPTSDHPS